MNNKILMISIKTLKDNYTVDDNLEDKYLISNIQKGMDFVIRPTIGDALYDEILVQINNGELSEKNRHILSQIEPVLAYFVLSEVVYSTAYKLKNKGLEDGSDSNRFNELVRVSKKYLLDSQHYQKLLEKELLKNEFNGTNSSDKKSSSKIYKTGLFLG